MTRSSQKDIPYHRVSWPASKQGELAASCQSLLRDGQGTGQRMESNCSMYHLFLLIFILPSPLFFTIINIIIVDFDSTLKCPYLNPQRFICF